jgi:hypothetical protein
MFSEGKGVVETRVLVAYDDGYRAYREVIAAGIRALRPHCVVATCTPDELRGGEPERFGPQVVICGRQGVAEPGDAAAWVELPPEFGRPARVRVGGSRRSAANPTLEDLLGIIDEAERVVLAQARAGRSEDPAPPPSEPAPRVLRLTVAPPPA